MNFQDFWSEFFTGGYSFGNANTRQVEGNVAIVKAVFQGVSDSIFVEEKSQFLLTDSIFADGPSGSIKSKAYGVVFFRNCFTNIKFSEYIVMLDNLDSDQSFAHIQQTSFSSSSGGLENVTNAGALYIVAQRAHTSNCNVTKISGKSSIGIKIDETKYGSTHHHNVFDSNRASKIGIATIEEGGGIIHDTIFSNNNGNEGIFYSVGIKTNTIQNCVFNGNEKVGNLIYVQKGSTCYVINCYIQAFNDIKKENTPYYINKLQSPFEISTNFAHDNDCSMWLINKEVLCRTENKSGLKITSIVLFSCFCLSEHDESVSDLRSELKYKLGGKEGD